jgi:carbon starvation protein
MSLIAFLAASAVILLLAYRWMGRALARVVGLDNALKTPAHVQRDGLDHEPARWSWLLPQHFSAIAAAGPIVGPILAGTMFGWLPTWIWIILGAIFVGGVHDFMTLTASVRHGAKSIAEVVRQHMNRRSHVLFLVFVWISLIYVIIAFADVTAGAFVQRASAADAAAPGPAVATSSLLYLGLAVLMGLSLRKLRWSEGWARLVFIPLVFAAIIAGPYLPLDLSVLLPGVDAQKAWNFVLLGYCFVAALVPLWLLLQPRGALGGYFLYVIIVAGVLGMAIGGLRGDLVLAAPTIGAAPWLFPVDGARPLFPILFITVACGACSGFHAIVASGTTSKQLDRETDARPVAYGAMLMESFFACISLAAVMIMAQPTGRPDVVFANGVALFIHHATFQLVPVQMAHGFALLCFATFIFDTLDACTRLARYVLMELLGWAGRRRAVLATALTLVVPALIVTLPPALVNGQPQAIWRVFWNLFGTSNQMLAALSLLAVTVWLQRRGRGVWFALGPMLLMLTMTLWSIGLTLNGYWVARAAGPVPAVLHVEAGVAALLLCLAVWLVTEALMLARTRTGAAGQPVPA